MKLRVDVSDVHALVALLCGGASVLFTLGCLFGVVDDNSKVAPIAIAGGIAVALWCGLFAVVLRGTAVTRGAAAVGLAGGCVAVCIGSCAASIHW